MSSLVRQKVFDSMALFRVTRRMVFTGLTCRIFGLMCLFDRWVDGQMDLPGNIQ